MTRHILRPLAAALSRLSGRTGKSDSSPQRDRRIASRFLKTKLPAHLLRDIGVDDR